MTQRGLGDTIAAATKAVGIKPCGGCRRRRRLLNKLINYSAGEKLIGQAVSTWAVGVTTAPRRESALCRCLSSIRGAGWDDPIIFAEPDSDLRGTKSSEIIHRKHRYGAWHNWLDMCEWLLREFPHAGAIMTVQDDTVITSGDGKSEDGKPEDGGLGMEDENTILHHTSAIHASPNCRAFLEHDLWPCANVGFVSLYTPKHYAVRYIVEKNGREVSKHINLEAAQKAARRHKADLREEPRPTGCHRVSTGGYWGACAMIFPRDALAELVGHPITANWKGVGSGKQNRKPHEIANVDTAVGKIVRAMGLEIRTYTPSLAQHVAKYSTLGHGDNRGKRGAIDYVGIDADLNSIFAAAGNTPRYYQDGTPHLTGDDQYDEAALEWHKASGKLSMSITGECWAAIRSRLQATGYRLQEDGMRPRTLEFGSGLSTLLFSQLGTDHTAVEDDHDIARRLQAAGRGLRAPVVCSLKPVAGHFWYKWQPDGPYDLILLDGPQGEGSRDGFLDQMDELCHAGTVIVVDDTHRDSERALAEKIAAHRSHPLTDMGRFAIIEAE